MTFAEAPVKRMGLAAVVASLMMGLGLSPDVFSQTGARVGSPRGTVTDEKGASGTGAQVTITNTDTAYSRSQRTSAEGNYDFQSLPIGRYSLKVSKGGFKTFEEKDILLHVSDSLTLDAQLKVGAVTETENVLFFEGLE